MTPEPTDLIDEARRVFQRAAQATDPAEISALAEIALAYLNMAHRSTAGSGQVEPAGFSRHLKN
jgi:hypothetical protein